MWVISGRNLVFGQRRSWRVKIPPNRASGFLESLSQVASACCQNLHVVSNTVTTLQCFIVTFICRDAFKTMEATVHYIKSSNYKLYITYHSLLAHTPAIADPRIFPTDVWEFHIPIIKPRLQKMQNKTNTLLVICQASG